MSPHRMLTTTIGDELQLFNDGRCYRSFLATRAILPAGHMAMLVIGWIAKAIDNEQLLHGKPTLDD